MGQRLLETLATRRPPTFFIGGLLDLYEATFELRWLEEALRVANDTEERFADEEHGGWYRTARDAEPLLAREKPNHDGAEPSGASVHVRNAVRLHTVTGEERWRRIAERALHAYAAMLFRPGALSEMLVALDAFMDVRPAVVLVWPPNRAVPSALLEPLRRTFRPNCARLGASDGDAVAKLARVAPVAEGKTTLGGRAAAYACVEGACRLPATDAAAMEEELTRLAAASAPSA